jgi:tight adherence protein C
MQFLIIGLAIVSAITLAAALTSLPVRSPTRRRLARLADGSRIPVPQASGEGLFAEDSSGWLIKLLKPVSRQGGKDGKDGKDGKESASHGYNRQRLIEAGYRRASAMVIYSGTRHALAITLPIVFFAMSPAWNLSNFQLIVLLCMAAAVGLVLPSYIVDKKRKARKMDMVLGLPDALDLMVVCVEAGLGINMSLQRISKEFARTHKTLSSEFELVTLEVRAGKSTTQALRTLAERTGVDEIHALVAMLVQTERFGTSLADTLRVHAESLRVQRMQRAEELAGKAPLKMLFPTLLIFAATLMVTVGPGFLQLTAVFRDR